MPDRLFFHSRSAVAVPGKGVNERLEYPTQTYSTLVANPHWRRALSNFWVSPFLYIDGHRYNTVEHCFQAQKLRIPYGPHRSAGPPRSFELTAAFELTLESLSQPSQGDGAAARALRKAVLLSQHELAYWDTQKEEVMAQAQFAKFSQCTTLRAVLLGTGEAELWHSAGRGQKPARMMSLERVRAALQQGCEALPPPFEPDTDEEAD